MQCPICKNTKFNIIRKSFFNKEKNTLTFVYYLTCLHCGKEIKGKEQNFKFKNKPTEKVSMINDFKLYEYKTQQFINN